MPQTNLRSWDTWQPSQKLSAVYSPYLSEQASHIFVASRHLCVIQNPLSRSSSHTLEQRQTAAFAHHNRDNICGTIGTPRFTEVDADGSNLELSHLGSSARTLYPERGASRQGRDTLNHRQRRNGNAEVGVIHSQKYSTLMIFSCLSRFLTIGTLSRRLEVLVGLLGQRYT